jgi:hypothetical protein
MNTIIQNLKDEAKKAELSFAEMLNSNSTNKQAAMKNMEAMKQIYGILDSQCAKVRNYKQRSASPKVVFIGDERVEVKTNKAVVETICKYIVTNHYKELSANITKMKSSVTGKLFISKNADDIENPTEIKVGRKIVYIDAYRMMTNNMMLFKKMLSVLNIDNIRIENAENTAIA